MSWLKRLDRAAREADSNKGMRRRLALLGVESLEEQDAYLTALEWLITAGLKPRDFRNISLAFIAGNLNNTDLERLKSWEEG